MGIKKAYKITSLKGEQDLWWVTPPVASPVVEILQNRQQISSSHN